MVVENGKNKENIFEEDLFKNCLIYIYIFFFTDSNVSLFSTELLSQKDKLKVEACKVLVYYSYNHGTNELYFLLDLIILSSIGVLCTHCNVGYCYRTCARYPKQSVCFMFRNSM